MPYFRVRIQSKDGWRSTWWGADEIPSACDCDDDPCEAHLSVPDCRLTIEQAREGLVRARQNYPAKQFRLKRFEDGDPGA